VGQEILKEALAAVVWASHDKGLSAHIRNTDKPATGALVRPEISTPIQAKEEFFDSDFP
jgi:hypothetical protein